MKIQHTRNLILLVLALAWTTPALIGCGITSERDAKKFVLTYLNRKYGKEFRLEKSMYIWANSSSRYKPYQMYVRPRDEQRPRFYVHVTLDTKTGRYRVSERYYGSLVERAWKKEATAAAIKKLKAHYEKFSVYSSARASSLYYNRFAKKANFGNVFSLSEIAKKKPAPHALLGAIPPLEQAIRTHPRKVTLFLTVRLYKKPAGDARAHTRNETRKIARLFYEPALRELRLSVYLHENEDAFSGNHAIPARGKRKTDYSYAARWNLKRPPDSPQSQGQLRIGENWRNKKKKKR